MGDSMGGLLANNEASFCLKFKGKMTSEFYRELEERVIEAIRLNNKLDIDLSEVTEIDLCGLHLVGLLQSVGVIVATSPIVAETSRRLLSTLYSGALGRVKNTRPPQRLANRT